MFKHSVKVPRLYKIAGKVTQQVREEGASIKDLVYNQNHPNIKAIYALVVETLQHCNDVNFLIRESNILMNEQRFDPWLARVLITELLWGKKRLSGDSKPIKTVLTYQSIFENLLTRMPANNSDAPVKKVKKPRYVRINTIYISVEEALKSFQEEGWELVPTDTESYKNFLLAAESLTVSQFMADFHVKELLLFHGKTQFHQHDAYKNGLIILQDKASCLPVKLLNPEPGCKILDMCAAPGMKTTQLAAELNNTCKIIACERDTRRYNTLCEMVALTGAYCVETLNKDALKLNDRQYEDIDYILVDPSCSGSGMDHFEIENVQMHQFRLQKLCNFQAMLLRHAFTNFSKVKRVVYSTCSIYPQENEEVVAEILKVCTNFKLVPAAERIGGRWNNFGGESYGEIGKRCLYAKPGEDLTHGFFVAVFERKSVAEELEGTAVDDAAANINEEREQDSSTKIEEEKSNNSEETIIKTEYENDSNMEKSSEDEHCKNEDILKDEEKSKKKKIKKECLTQEFNEDYLEAAPMEGTSTPDKHEKHTLEIVDLKEESFSAKKRKFSFKE